MTDNVIPFGSAPIESDAKAEFLRHVAEGFDLYLERNEEEPEAIVFVLGGARQTSHTGWMMRGDSEGAASSVKALALVSLTKAIVNPEGGE